MVATMAKETIGVNIRGADLKVLQKIQTLLFKKRGDMSAIDVVRESLRLMLEEISKGE